MTRQPGTPAANPPRSGPRSVVRGRVVAGIVGLVVMAAWGLGISPGAWAAHLAAAGDPLVAALDPPPRRGQPVHLVVVVSDTRADVAHLGESFGDLDGARADAVLLVRQAGSTVGALSLPRDLLTSTAAGDLALASLLDHGGPDLLVGAVRDLTGAAVHHYVELDLAGVAAVVDALGGVEVTSPHPVRDSLAGLRQPAGPARLDGAGAVAWLRARQPEVHVDGAWVPLPSGDLARIERSHALLGAVFERVRALGPVDRARVAARTARVVRADATLAVGTVGRLARLAGDDQVQWCATTLPVRPLRPAAERVSPLGPPHVGTGHWLVPAASRGGGGTPDDPCPSAAVVPAGAGSQLPGSAAVGRIAVNDDPSTMVLRAPPAGAVRRRTPGRAP